MALLQPRLSLKVAQRQVLTPGLMQMVSVLALNKLELKEMIDAEMVENPVLEEIDETVPMLDEVAGREERLERGVEETAAPPKDVFNEIDFGSYFQDYLDPGYRTQPEYEDSEKPSFENFLSQPTTLSDHLAWQLGALSLDAQSCTRRRSSWSAIWMKTATWRRAKRSWPRRSAGLPRTRRRATATRRRWRAALDLIVAPLDLVQHLDPAGVGARDLRECLAMQIAAQQQEFDHLYGSGHWGRPRTDAARQLPRRGRGQASRSGGAPWKWRR